MQGKSSGSRESTSDAAFGLLVHFASALPQSASLFCVVCLGFCFWIPKALKAEVEAQTNRAKEGQRRQLLHSALLVLLLHFPPQLNASNW
jgi:hypothetical protein